MYNFESVAKTLDELLQELLSKGVSVAEHVIRDLKELRSLAGILQRDPDNPDLLQKTMIAKEKVEMNLLALAEIHVDQTYSDTWQNRVSESLVSEIVKTVRISPQVAGVPHGSYWVRYLTDDLAGIPNGCQLLAEYGLQTIPQEDGYSLIYGDKEKVIAFLKALRPLLREQKDAILKKL